METDATVVETTSYVCLLGILAPVWCLKLLVVMWDLARANFNHCGEVILNAARNRSVFDSFCLVNMSTLNLAKLILKKVSSE